MPKRKEETPEEFQERTGGYEVKPDEDMSGHGWVKEVTFKFLDDQEDKSIVCREVDFYVKDFRCQCGSNAFLWFAPQRNGVYLCCTYCSTAEGPISSEEGITRRQYKVTPEQAIQILTARGWTRKDLRLRHYLKLARKTAKTFVPRERPKKSA